MGPCVLRFYRREERTVFMTRAIRLAIIGILACTGAWAQITPGTSTVKVGTSIEGPIFFVDGRQFTTTQTFLWPNGSKHTVQFLLSVDPLTGANLGFQFAMNDTIRYSFGGWQTNGPALIPAASLVQVV